MAAGQPFQPSFEDLGQSLFDATFVVVDLETTGLSPATDRITEIGAVKTRRGEVLGELQTLVHPGRPIPPAVTAVTGITDALVRGSPPIEAALPTFLEFLGDAVLVAHNAGFDAGFLAAACARLGYPRPGNTVLDTAAIARRIVRDEVRDVRLRTLARHFRSRTVPEHRALIDARATVDVFHGLLERAGALGAVTVEDLRDYTRSASDRLFRKVGLVRDAPPACGVYAFLDDRGVPLYIGKATSLRPRLRQYFGGDRRRRVDALVRETARVVWRTTPTVLAAEALEARALAAWTPRYNRAGARPRPPVWVKLTREPFPRLAVVTAPRDAHAFHVGPLPSRRVADRLVDAVHDAAPLRQCRQRLRLAQDHPACVLKDLGRCGAPCDGSQTREDYAAVVEHVRAALSDDPDRLLAPLRRRMEAFAREGRFERAAEQRRRYHGAAETLSAVRRRARVRDGARLVAARSTPDGLEVVRIEHGRLCATALAPRDADDDAVRRALATAAPLDEPWPPVPASRTPDDGPDRSPTPVEGEVRLLTAWLERPGVRALEAHGEWWSVVGADRALAAAAAEARRTARRLRRDGQTLAGAKIRRRSDVAQATGEPGATSSSTASRLTRPPS